MSGVCGSLWWLSIVVSSGRSTVQSPVRVSLGPVSTTSLFLLVILTLVLVKIALQSLSHICPIDNRFPVFRPSKTLALFAFLGMFGIASCVLVFDCMACPLGQPTVNGAAGLVSIFRVRIT